MWVAVLHVSHRTAAKIASKHGFDVDQVKEALVCVNGLVYTWNQDPQRGLRAIVEVKIGSRRTLAVLYPVNEASNDRFQDVWRLGSIYRVQD